MHAIRDDVGVTWQERAIAHHQSARRIGELLHKRLPRGLRTKWQPAHLSNKVSELLGGKAGWWERTGGPALGHLADLLDTPVDEMLGAHEPGPHLLGFPEFPALPPLGLDEVPFTAPPTASLLAHALRPDWFGLFSSKWKWVVAPPGSGKTLAIRYLTARPAHRTCAATVDTLDAALALEHHGADVVIEVERTAPGDVAAIEALQGSARTCTVLAPFAIPLRELRGERHGMASGWSCIHPDSFLTWRSEFAAWIVDRISGVKGRRTRLDVLSLERWLEENDPSGEIVASPGDLVALCADFDAHGAQGAALGRRAERWLRDVGTRQVGDHVPAAWKQRLAARSYASMLQTQFRDLHTSLSATSLDAWERLVPREVAPRRRRGQLDAALVVSAFREAGLLGPGDAGLVAYPRWVGQGCLEMSLEDDFDAKDPAGWGLLAADSSRMPAVDGALDRLALGAFRRLLKATVRAFDRASLGRRAALEAVFASAARRLRTLRVDPRDVEAFQTLTRLQLENLERGGWSATPYFRRDPEEFLANAWTLSSYVPALRLEEDPGWLAPGWCTTPLSLDDIPGRVLGQVLDVGASDPLHPSRRICEIGPQVVAGLAVQYLGDNIPRVLLPALFVDTQRDWPLRPEHLRGLGHDTFEEGELRRLGEALEPAERASLATRVWRLLAPGQASVVEKIELLCESFPRLASYVLANVPAETVRETVRGSGLHVRQASPSSIVERSPSPLLRLPSLIVTAAVREWSDCPALLSAKWVEAQSLVQILGTDDIDLLIALARQADEQTAIQFARVVWETDVEAARTEIEADGEAGRQPASYWYWSAPRTELPFVASWLRQPLPDWTKKWAYARAPEAGPAADGLYEISMAYDDP